MKPNSEYSSGANSLRGGDGDSGYGYVMSRSKDLQTAVGKGFKTKGNALPRR